MAHKGHSECVWTSKAACDRAIRQAIGACSSMVTEDRQCGHWGIDRVDDKPYCGTHLRSIVLATDEARRIATKKAEMNERIDRALAWRKQHPSVWDAPPT